MGVSDMVPESTSVFAFSWEVLLDPVGGVLSDNEVVEGVNEYLKAATTSRPGTFRMFSSCWSNWSDS